MNLEKLAVQGRTKIHKSMAASVSSHNLIQMRKRALKSCFEDFYSRDHRLEHVASVHNIEFVDDSKADNVNSTWFSLESMNNPLVWIVAGNPNDEGYEKLNELSINKVKAIVCVNKGGENALRKSLGAYVRMFVEVKSIENAVSYAFNLASKGDTVLYSPASNVDNADFRLLGEEYQKVVNRL